VLDQPALSVAVLLAGRVLLALGESLVVTGTMGWGIALVGPQHGGKVMAWLGIAIYAAWPAAHRWVWRSAPGDLRASRGERALADRGAAGRQPLAWWRPVPVAARLYQVLGAVWQPGWGWLLQRRFRCHHGIHRPAVCGTVVGDSSLAFTSFGVAFIVARACFFAPAGPDRWRQSGAGVLGHRGVRAVADLAG
jgi:hypothetical protein